ncbi:MAG TPA: DUF58 domain-containing protein [Microbacterium sp.]|uniref:DUF58 domain-containing protein n=1 Tax=Microbacterium sp. TaxID=51671 RepID=UPI002CCF3F40|nr:DUF58 domain-containing protein [Microbacterium sp.]HWI31732.1 DUF58 domain-containing protein [Microbacterium sp.]
MRRLWPLTLRGTGAVALAVACLILSGELALPVLMYFALLLFAVVGASVISLYAMKRGASVTRALSTDVAAVGRESTVTVAAGLRSALPVPPGRWEDGLPKALAGEARGAFPALSSGMRSGERAVELSYSVTGKRRGVHAIGPLTITSSDPFGFARRRLVIGDRTPVTIVPAVSDLPPLANAMGEAGGSLHSSTSQLGQGADNLIARPYASGDSMRRIHWRATAHRDQLMVRQEEQESTPEATVVLDLGALRWSTDALSSPGADPGFEAGVSACVSIAARLAKEGYTVEVIDTDGTALADPLDSDADIDDLLARFATLTARRDDHLERLAALFAGVTTGPVIVIVGRLHQADAEAIAPLAHHSTLPVLLAVAPAGGALERAAQAGWRCAHLDPDEDLATSWARIGRETNRVFA